MFAGNLGELGYEIDAIGGEQPYGKPRTPRDAFHLQFGSLVAQLEQCDTLPVLRKPIFVSTFRITAERRNIESGVAIQELAKLLCYARAFFDALILGESPKVEILAGLCEISPTGRIGGKKAPRFAASLGGGDLQDLEPVWEFQPRIRSRQRAISPAQLITPSWPTLSATGRCIRSSLRISSIPDAIRNESNCRVAEKSNVILFECLQAEERLSQGRAYLIRVIKLQQRV